MSSITYTVDNCNLLSDVLLRNLYDNAGKRITTSDLLVMGRISPTRRPTCLSILHEAKDKGIVVCEGKGNFRWRFVGRESDLKRTFAADQPCNSSTRKFSKRKASDKTSDDEALPKRRLPDTSNCRKCGGSGKWVNPHNSSDVRPCFYCRTKEAEEANRKRDDHSDDHEHTKPPTIEALPDLKDLKASVAAALELLGKHQVTLDDLTEKVARKTAGTLKCP